MAEITVGTPQEIGDRLARMAMEFPEVVSNAVWYELSIVMNESKKLCPVNTGALRGSGYVPEPEYGPGSIKATLGYSQGYAWWVHEILENYHKPPTQAKYLEEPLVQALPKIVDSIVERTIWLIQSGIGSAQVARDVKRIIGG